MKLTTKITIIFIILSAILIAGCYGPLNPAGPGDGTGGIVLPKDTASDTARSYSGEFAFETLLPVEFRVKVEHYEETIGPKGGTAVLEPGAVRVYVSLTNESGSTVFQGMTGETGEINRTVYLPAAEEDMTLTLEAEGFETRRAVIQDMVRYEKIDRVMAMAGTGGIISAKGMEPDSDGDGVPDAYDIDPYDASAAFEIGVPADGNLTIAFEDLYGRANAGDADYNDFVAEYSIVETLDGDSRLKKIRVDVTGIEKIAGYEHTFGIRINAFGADNTADVEGEYIDANGNTVPFTMTDRKSPINIELFKRTSKAEKKSAYFVLTLKNSENIDELAEDEDVIVDRPPYNPYLYVKNTGKDVHLIGEESLDGSYDPLMFMDENNFPWALLVPDTWQPPTEAHRIEEFYPRFTRWRESGGELSPDWYHHDTPYQEDEKVYVAGYYNDGDHDVAAYWKDGVRTDLTDGTANARANSIYVYDGDVYVAGYYDNGRRETAVYWKNGGTPIKFSSGSEDRGEAEEIFVDSTGVYLAGFYTSENKETVWYTDNGIETFLVTNNSEANATGLMVKNGGVYVSGYYNNGVYPYVATYWKDGTKVTSDLFAEKSQGLDIFVTDSEDIYVSGLYYDTTEKTFGSSYWRNDENGHNPLYNAGLSFANAVKVDSDTVYTVGFYMSGAADIACYWKDDGNPIDLDAGRGNDIWVEADTVYVAGYHFDGVKNIAVIWENGTRTDLYDSNQKGVHAEATTIFVE